YGLERRLASFRSVEMGIPEVLADAELFFDRVLHEGRRAVEDDGAEVVVLSEIATLAFWERARAELPVPLVDPGVTCWKWAELGPRLPLDAPTLTVSDLLLTKLQIVELNAKDADDAAVLLRTHDLGRGEGDHVDLDYLAGLAGDDWGLWRTLAGTLERLEQLQ